MLLVSLSQGFQLLASLLICGLLAIKLFVAFRYVKGLLQNEKAKIASGQLVKRCPRCNTCLRFNIVAVPPSGLRSYCPESDCGAILYLRRKAPE